MFFFSWGTFSLWVHTGRLEDDRSEGSWALVEVFFYLFFLSFFVFFFVFLLKKEGTFLGKKDT